MSAGLVWLGRWHSVLYSIQGMIFRPNEAKFLRGINAPRPSGSRLTGHSRIFDYLLSSVRETISQTTHIGSA